MAAREGHLDVVMALINAKADVNVQTTLLGRTALHAAASTGHFDTVKALVTHGADTAILDRFGQKAVDVAADETISTFLKRMF